MNEQAKQILKVLNPYILLGKKYLNFIVIVLFLIIYVVLVVIINDQSAASPTVVQYQTEVSKITNRKTKIDPNVVKQIQQLQDQNQQVKALFNQARNNPFSE